MPLRASAYLRSILPAGIQKLVWILLRYQKVRRNEREMEEGVAEAVCVKYSVNKMISAGLFWEGNRALIALLISRANRTRGRCNVQCERKCRGPCRQNINKINGPLLRQGGESCHASSTFMDGGDPESTLWLPEHLPLKGVVRYKLITGQSSRCPFSFSAGLFPLLKHNSKWIGSCCCLCLLLDTRRNLPDISWPRR